MKRSLLALKILQEKEVERNGRKGEYVIFTRLNKKNPLSYIFLVTALIPLFLLYGLIGVLEMWKNPFRWK